MEKTTSLSKIGFGCYRVSVKSNEHYEALYQALIDGCNLIDTSSNYTDGDSELLIGKVLKENPQFSPFIISKAGYIQGSNLKVLKELQKNKLALNDVIHLDEGLKHSIHPEFLQSQINLSLKRLGQKRIDCFLLHNPEYYFKQAKVDLGQDEYYQRIKMAFKFLEEKVDQGVIGQYGISSNSFPFPLDHPEVTNLAKILEIAEEISPKHHFKMIQFPYNLIENQATQKHYGDKSLVQFARENGITTIINRPLNAFNDNGLIRLATYEQYHQELSPEDEDDIFALCTGLIKRKWNETGIPKDFEEIPLMKQFKDIWKTLPTPDAVDQVFYGHLFPFLMQLWGGQLSLEESKPFVLLYDTTLAMTRNNMTKKALMIKRKLNREGILGPNDIRSLAVQACDHYLNEGVDHVLVGMRRTSYVSQLKELF